MGAPRVPADAQNFPPEGDIPSKVFTREQANRLLPSLEAIFREMDNRSVRLREVGELIQDLEEYWGSRILDSGFRDRGKYLQLIRERDDLQASIQEDIERIHALGVILKDVQSGLVDFYGVVDDKLVFLCWQRGEPAVRFYHTLEGGFAGRRPLAAVPQD